MKGTQSNISVRSATYADSQAQETVETAVTVLPETVMQSSLYIKPTPDLNTFGGIKLGWIQGVLIPCLLNIWGVMLFLRIAWIVAQAGVGFTILIIFLTGLVCIITTLSLSAICTNGTLQGGGIYFLVSRSLGAELGASVGLIFAFANSVAASMNTIGFCESLNDLLRYHGLKIIDNAENDTRIIGIIALLVMCIICAIGMDWETKTQNLLIVTIVTAIFNYIIGALMGPVDDEAKAQGFVGVNIQTASENWGPEFRFSDGTDYNFISIFAIYFPSMTGVQSGANICGDLRNPAVAIPKGTLLALAISICSYLIMAILSGAGGLRDASGQVAHVGNHTLLASCKPDCEYGLFNNYKIMHLMALYGPLIYLGCWAATLSTALTNLLSVPRLIQALGTDRIYPGLIFFSKQYGRHGEPYRGYVLVFIISSLFLLIADLNSIAPLITNFYLAAYALINFCTFHAAFIKPINWRPSFRFYNLWLSFAGFIMCLIIMMIISWIMALVTTFIFLSLYLAVLYRSPETNWAGSADARHYQVTVTQVLHMARRSAPSKGFYPQLLILSGQPYTRDWLLYIGNLITAVGSFSIVAEIQKDKVEVGVRNEKTELGEDWLRQHAVRGVFVFMDGFSFEEGIRALILCSGLGQLSPNVVLMGFMYEWRTREQHHLLSYYQALRAAFEIGLAVTILRYSRKRNLSRHAHQHDVTTFETKEMEREKSKILRILPEDSDMEVPAKREISKAMSSHHIADISDIPAARTQVEPFEEGSTLDVWWLYNDGGINILLPYIIAKRGSKKHMNLRVFVVPQGNIEIEESYEVVKNLFQKFRIEYTQLMVIEDVNMPPRNPTWDFFNQLIANHKTDKKESAQDPSFITNDVYQKLLRKTTKHLRIRELLHEHSYHADFIVMSLPYPREETVPAALYLAWLDAISQGLPTVMFVRGNPHQTVF